MKIYIGWSLNYFEKYILHGRVFVLFSHFPVQPHKIARNSKTQTVFLGRDNKGPDQSVQMLLSGSLFSPMKKVFFLMMLVKALKTCNSMQVEHLSSGFLTRSYTNQAVQPQKMARGLRFQIYKEEGLSCLCSKNKGADQLHGCLYYTEGLLVMFPPTLACRGELLELIMHATFCVAIIFYYH